MKVSDIIKDDNDAKINGIINHLKRRRKANPKKSNTSYLSNWVDVFGGMGGYQSDPTDGSSDVIQ